MFGTAQIISTFFSRSMFPMQNVVAEKLKKGNHGCHSGGKSIWLLSMKQLFFVSFAGFRMKFPSGRRQRQTCRALDRYVTLLT